MTPAMLMLLLAAEPERIPGDELARTLELALDGTKVHLDKDATVSGKRVRRSFVELPDAFGGKRSEFSVPDQALDMGAAGRVVYRVNDVNLDKLAVKSGESDYTLSLFFEDQGKEALAQHSGGMFDLGGVIPDLQMNKMHVDVGLTPEQNALAFSKAKVKFDADIAPDGSGAALTGSLEGYKRQVKDSIEHELQKFVDDILLEQLNQKLKTFSGVHFEGVDLVRDAVAEKTEKKAPPPKQVKPRKKR
jgi:hypothetical protein